MNLETFHFYPFKELKHEVPSKFRKRMPMTTNSRYLWWSDTFASFNFSHTYHFQQLHDHEFADGNKKTYFNP